MSAGNRAVIVAARRTAVCPRGGALARLQADELAAPVFARLLADAGIAAESVDHVLLGNALYGGGNPARLAALRAGLPPSVPAMTIDTQCCSGLDAILHGARLIESGAADCVLAGGAESFSRAPIRMRRPLSAQAKPEPYDRPPFAPPPYNDPDLAQAAADLAEAHALSRRAQADFATSSHQKARSVGALLKQRLVTDGGKFPDKDGFTRVLSRKTALRAPLLAGAGDTGLSAATIACEADGAAAVLLVSDALRHQMPPGSLLVRAAVSRGGDPSDPALVPNVAARSLLAAEGLTGGDLDAVELMEAYASQAMVTAADLAFNPEVLNRLGGALARGHPIGASGAILAVQLFEALKPQESPAEGGRGLGLAMIAAAGGLGSVLLVERFDREAG